MECKEVKFSGHAIRRMFERKLDRKAVTEVIQSGEIIAEYLDDSPYPSYLFLGFVRGLPLHVVVAFDKVREACYIITTYVPDDRQWHEDFKTRKRR